MRPNVSDASTPTRTPRICLLTETFYPVVGGGETHARLLARQLNLLGMSTFILTRRSALDLPVREDVEGTPVHRVPPTGMKRLGKYVMVPFVLLELFRRQREYDLIFVCGFRVLGLPAVTAARLLGKSCVLRAEAQGEMSGGYASAYRRLPAPIAFVFRAWIALRNRMLRRADGFVAISKTVAEEFIECRMDPRRIATLANGIDSEAFYPADGGVEPLRHKLGLPPDAVIFAYSGKLNQGKGLEHLLKSWTDAVHTRENLHLVLVGSGGGQSLSCEDDLRGFVHAHSLESSVTFTGYVENVHEYLQASDVFVLPSENEALPLSLLEAMSCGLPCIATRVGGIPEAVDHLETGILIEPSDPDALARAMMRLLDDQELARALATNARKSATERFSIRAVASRYRRLFSSVHPASAGSLQT